MKTLKRRAIKLVIILFVIVAIAAVLALIPKAKAQMVCGKRSDIVTALKGGHSENLIAEGLSGNGGLVELFVSDKGTWTLLMTMPGGPTCLLGTGEEWQTFKPGRKA